MSQDSRTEEIINKFYQFFLEYRDIQTGERKYRERIIELAGNPSTYKFLNVDFVDIVVYDSSLALEISQNPWEMTPYMQVAAYEALKILQPIEAEKIRPDEIHIALRGEGAGEELKLRDVSSAYIGKLISVQGLLVKLSQVYTRVFEGVYKCSNCEGEIIIKTERTGEILKAPQYCPYENGKRRRFELVSGKSRYKDVQYARIQERPEELPPGQIPRFIDVILEEPLIDVAFPGDYVRIVGILDLEPSKTGDGRYQFKIVALSMESLGKEAVEISLTDKDIEKLKELGKDEGFYDRILDSFSPSIYGYKHIKEALLLAIIGASSRDLPDGTRIRGKIHILLLGDPGVAKSQLLKYAASIAPKGIYTSGRGATAAGLTAAVIKDQAGGMSLEAGAVVLADVGICAIDEIDKMKPEDRVAIHEAMEQMTVSVSKGGIVATLNARTTILAAANPKHGRYNPNISFIENINLPSTLISRFDIIHLMRDRPDPDRDKRLIEHMVETRTSQRPYEGIYDPLFLKKYILYARTIKPKLTEGASRKLMEFYRRMRLQYDEEYEAMPITPRQFEALLRISEASAKAHLREEITEEDAEIAINQVSRILRDVAVDVETGKIDVTLLTTGTAGKKASKTETILNVIREMDRESEGQQLYIDDVIQRVVQRTRIKDPVEVENIINRLADEGVLYKPHPNTIKLVRRTEKK